MFSISNIILRTEVYSIEIEKLYEDNMVLFFQNGSFCFQVACRWKELWSHYCITSAAEIGHAVVDLKQEAKRELVLIHYQTNKNTARDFHISINV